MDKTPRSLDSLVESQVQRWLAERRRAESVPDAPRPVITISREYGARGAAVGHLIAERLNFAFWNRELLAAIATHAKLERSLLAPFDEHHRSPLVGIVRGMIPEPIPVSQQDYARELAAVVQDIVLRGGAVLVGRGLNFLIQPERCLRVRVMCPLEQRVRDLAERERISPETARATVEYADRDRREFVRDLFGREIDDPSTYDLWVNTGTMSVDAASAVVIAAYRFRFGDQVMRAPAQPPPQQQRT